MIKSMTGYGHYSEIIDGKDISVEIKSVNHRYFEFSARTSRGYAFLEEKIKSYVQSRVSRGKVDVYVSVVSVDETAAEVVVNQSLAAGYVNALRELKDTYNLDGGIDVQSIIRFSDIFTVRKKPDDEDRIWEAVKAVAEKAVDSFISMRETEGARLKADVSTRAENILKMVEVIENQSPQTVSDYMEKLKTRINELLGDATVDEQRLITEVAIFADKVAVAEETVRLRSHFKQMNEMLSSDVPVGRKLDFIVQEMNRETNTIGSKAQDAAIAHIVVDIKAEIEKIREQIQNIE